ncbi:serine/threonine protein kinase [Corallococcus sp. AB011P]|uniref:serine/threonine-protein kinase n=1 Tax=Corallococcus sp. AB011P TaxID=2316735 RepID=UPI000EA266C2|nr:serine/threonine-protein kinase [Corallococcus sp. AB011P]RKG55501.1 serine/threonine protein kinase [Corallococcus sp. AB011P]
MKLPKRKGRLFRLPFADAPESRARLWKSMTDHGLFVPEDTPQPIGTEFALQVAFQGDGPAVSGRVRVMEHGVSGWVRGYFAKFVALDAGCLPLPLSPREPLAHATVGTPAASTSAGAPGGNADSWREEPTPVGIRPRSTVDGASALNDYSHLELLHARDPEAWQGGLRPFDAFGPYQLLQRLGTGGMAEVILSRRTMAEGVDKLVALKLVFQEYARHPRLSELFLTEARLSATLQHPNVIQVFDVGSAAGRPFMAMEYVHGRNGADLVQALRQRGRPPPVALAVTIAIELGKALEYLHGQRDLGGRPLHLVHRDVSPGNLLVGLHGEVKLVDMGVASASIASGNALLVEAHAGPTEFRVTRTARGMHLSVSRGRLLLSEGTHRRTLEAGNWLDVARGLEDAEHDGPPFPTSLSPGVDARIAWSPELRIPLSWRPLDDARSYQVQVARDLGFRQRIVDTQVEGLAFTFVPPEPGMFVWRVSALDSEGRPGEPGFARRVFVERQRPRGLLVTPRDGYEAPKADEDLVFAWQSIGGAPRYRLVVARDRELRHPVLMREGSPQQVVLPGLAPGEYSWGVYVAEDPPVPLFQKARRLVVPGPSGARARDALLPMER